MRQRRAKQPAAGPREPGPVYLDCNATTPLEPSVRDVIVHYLDEDFGNAASRTHEYGTRAKKAVEDARAHVARVVEAKPEEIVFTSGATEANNLALLGLAAHGERTGKRHVLSTAIEHKAVLEPLESLHARGFDVELIPPNRGGWIEPGQLLGRLRPETLLVSVMHVNNETGVAQPLREICARLRETPAFLHVDAAQGFGKDLEPLRDPRIDMLTVSAHKIFGPKGVGALVARRRGFERPPLRPITFGGGHERGLRPGTLPVPLIAGFGEAARLALRHHAARQQRCTEIRREAIDHLAPLQPTLHGDPARQLPHVLNCSFPGVDSEALIVALKGLAAISNGSACTSHSYSTSHVLEAMGLDAREIAGAVRISWSHLTPTIDWAAIAATIKRLRA